ncbi:hypothetical protein [Crossiella sp. CA198]|uniref:hypothetical protein n=1 Tax=Crossiella sp. CA198 TaxID=3455607 RepID=UPI003F8D6068
MAMLKYTFDDTANPELAGKSVLLDTEELRLEEAEDLEKVTGKPVNAVFKEFQQDRASGIRAFVWLATRRNGYNIKYSELSFNIVKTIMTILPEAEEDEAAPVDPLDHPETDPVSAPT